MRGTALWVRTPPQHGETESDLYVSHDTNPSFGATLIIERHHGAR